MIGEFGARALSVVLTIVYLLSSAAACSEMPEQQADQFLPGVPLGSSTLGVSISILQSRPEISLSLLQVTDSYAAEQSKRVSFSIQTVTDPNEYRIALRSRMAAGNAPDLFHLLSAGDTVELASRLEPLEDDLPWAENSRGNLLDSVQLDSHLYGVPYSLEGMGLLVNRRIFEAAEVSLSEIDDFGSLAEALYALRDQIAAEELAESFPELDAVTDFAGLDSGWLGETVGELLLTESCQTPMQAHYAATVRLPMTDAVGSLVDLLARCSPSSGQWSELIKVSKNRLSLQGIATQRIAAALVTTDAAGEILAANPELAGQLDLLPVYLDGMEEGVYYVGAPAWWAISADADEGIKAGAGNFLSWLYNSPEGNQTFLEQFGAISPYPTQTRSQLVGVENRLLTALEEEKALPRLSAEAPYLYQEDVLALEVRQYLGNYDKKWSQVARACEEGWAALR